MSGTKHDQGKPRISLLPPLALIEVAKVSTFGAQKYGDHNWLNGLNWSRLADAAGRHKLCYLSGERVDSESGLSHIAHVAWNELALLEYELRGLGKDDLWKGKK